MHPNLTYLHLVVSCIQVLASTNRYCRTGSHNVALDPNSAGPQEGNMNGLRFAIREPWPMFRIPNKGNIRSIRYCFANAEAKAKLDCPLQKGFTIWAEALGFPGSAENGHCLACKEVTYANSNKDERIYPSCYLDDYKSKKEPGTWNPKVRQDVLAIHLGEAMEAPYASMGYIHKSQQPGRHFLVMGPDTQGHRVAHEIGHVLGMLHEQGRWDRDDHVLFRCNKLVGYKDALIAASIAAEPDAAERLCTVQEFANRYGFEAGAQYIKNDAFNLIDAPIMDEGPFDLGSIMIYPSNAYASDPDCWEKKDLSACPLVAVGFGSTWPIAVNVAPSNGDVQFVKTWYKWVEGGSLQSPAQGLSTVASGGVERVRDGGKREVVRVHRVYAEGGEMVVR